MAEERVRIEVTFEGGHAIGVLVPTTAADALGEALARSQDGVFELEADDGHYLIPLRNVVYVKRFAREAHIGFGVGA